MKKKFRLWLCRKLQWFRRRSMYVILDPADSSVTLSQDLFDHMDVMNQEQAKVFVFTVSKGKYYAFTLNPDIEQPTQLCDIQYNSKHRCIGFETLCPTVNRILYDYGLPSGKPVKLSVEMALTYREDPKKIAVPISYYKILRP